MDPEERTAEVSRTALLDELRGTVTTSVEGAIERSIAQAFRSLDFGRVAMAAQDPPSPAVVSESPP